jgi:glycosyltransferase involved in cell wall biosynthesis
MSRRLRVALVSRELFPFGGGGIGEYVSACARVLSQIAEVTVFTSGVHEDRATELSRAGDPRLLPGDVQLVFVEEPGPQDIGGYFSLLHLYGARVLDALRGHYGREGPDLVEFSDYLGEGAVTVQARRAGDPMLRRSLVTIRLHTSAEVCAVLDGHVDDGMQARMTCELERLAMRDADYIVWPGGDTFAFYERFYGARNIAPGARILNPVMEHGDDRRAEPPGDRQAALRLLYLGRLERRKGVQNLVRAVNYLDSEHLRVDILGGDTDTAPLGTSMNAQLQMMAAGDPRINFLEPVPRVDLPRVIRASDAVVLPSLWEAWPYVGLEALRLNRPLVATPVGGFTEMVKDGASGWLSSDTSAAALTDLLGRLLFARDEIEALRQRRGPAETFAQLTDPDAITHGYEALLAAPGRWTPSGAGVGRPRGTPAAANGRARSRSPQVSAPRPPLVSVVIPYYRLARYIEAAVVSALEQTHPRIEVIVVNDGSMLDADWVLAELASRHPLTVVSQLNSGLGAARNFGMSQARGRYVVPLDADNLLEPTFVERALEVAEADSQAAFVTSWSRYINEAGVPLPPPNVGYQPIGNAAPEVLRNNVAGDAIALLRRRLFDIGFSYSEDLTSYEDWQLYQQLHLAGHHGVVIPERLVRYRVRADSMIRQIGFPQTSRLAGELEAHLRERGVRWTLARG